MHQKPSLLRRIAHKVLVVFGIFIVGLIMFMGFAYAIYYSPAPADLPCRGCTGEAQIVNVNGFDLYYRSIGLRGQNSPIVLLHGGPGMSSQTFKKAFDFLADRYQVVYYDQRGSGNSQIKPDPSDYTIEQLVEELETLRRDVLKSDQMILIGHSAGGALAQHYALKYPQHVDRMILICALPANGGMSLSGLPLDAMVALMNVLAGNIPPADPQAADAKFVEVGYRASLSRLYDPSHPEIIQDFGYASFAVNRDITRSTYGGNYDEQLKQLPVKTLILWGAGDASTFTGESAARQMHSVLKNSTLVGFERSGHWPYLEEPQRFQQELNAFLSK